MKKSILIIVAMIMLGSVSLSACNSIAPTPDTAPAAQEPTSSGEASAALDPYDPAMQTGDIYMAGSSTVGPLSEAVAESFIADGFQGQIKNDIIGSGAGFKRFCGTGESDISNASRPIKTAEIENCQQLTPARNPIAFTVAIDGIAIVVSKENEFLTDVSLTQLAQIFGSSNAVLWSDIDPSWPAEDIQRFTPGTDSGTFEYFIEGVIQKGLKVESFDDAKALALGVSNIQFSEDDNVLVQGVEGSPYAIGYFGVAYYLNASDKLNVISIDGLLPTQENAEAGTYALARPLFIYSDSNIIKSKPQIAAFINYYLNNVNRLVAKVGYFPAKQSDLDASKKALEDALD
ncbi:MAG: PstS family phosphate ABC transporter substrate-binding protein [Anaerolineaceae bacterium]|nr:PstS family phosphate ABC transporter substrate-binding protein [Anaerolineaceae bacterium]